ncbi:unnamed protein product [Onchocerca flexuosa]|uniref:Uncharacterized protein n=1 Tax=Onchocerca flexuosa TaxID=387005 RepID=A0A3P7UQ26_9BILA|nr:unnamed protein product [Onchocerca flexuosa]
MSFKPTHLTVECESRNHAGQVDDERHFFVQIASNNFEGLQAIQKSKTFHHNILEFVTQFSISNQSIPHLEMVSIAGAYMHRLINNCLREELAGPVHALRIDAYATSKFSNNPPTIPPKCAQNHTDHFST